MAPDNSDSNASSQGEDGLRRRRSGQLERSEVFAVSPEGEPPQPLLRDTRRVFTDPEVATGATSNSSASDSSSLHTVQPQRSRTFHNSNHVRFSLDHQDRDATPSGTSPRDEAEYDDDDDNGKRKPKFQRSALRQLTGQRPGTPNLTLDTRRANEAANQHGHKPPKRSPLSPQSSRSVSLQGPSATPKSATRPRGYSLRRSLFNKNVQGQMGGSIIELQETGGSAPASSSQGSSAYGNAKNIAADVSLHALESQTYVQAYGSKAGSKSIQGLAALPHYRDWLQKKANGNATFRSIKAAYSRTKKFVLRINEIPPSQNGRHVELDASRRNPLIDERTQKPFVPNTIRSSRYNAWNFVPRQLFAQFSKLANFYFLCISILQMIPGLSTTGTYTTIVPLLFFVSISIAKEGYDDYRRYKLDQEENNRETLALNAYQSPSYDSENQHASRFALKRWATTKWKDIQVGDIVKLERDQPAPADLVLLHSTGEKGVAYIETMALDGETNLKSKFAASCLAENCDTLDKLVEVNAHLVVEDPNLDLYNFEGKATTKGETAPLTSNEVIYRGSILRNTSEAIGLVVYSGEECKIRMNANKNPRIKAPSLQAVVNKVIILIVVFVLALSLGNSIAYEIWSEFEERAWYLHRASVAFGKIIVSFIIMFNTMIPLSLYVSLEIVKVSQRFLLNDIDMYDPVSDTPMEARTSTINEELGQISYVFSDKTGTLTDNSMKFRKMSVAGTAWLHDTDLQEEAAREQYKQRLVHKKRNKGKKIMMKSRMSESDDAPRTSTGSALLSPLSPDLEDGRERSPTRWKSSARPSKSQPELCTQEMILYIQRKPFTIFARKARFFLLSIALCHTCLPEIREDGSINLQAASPDELALVQAAQELGFMVIDRSSGVLQIKTFPNGFSKPEQIDRYQILDVIEFSSKRKRMSVVVRFPDGRICVVSKGADTTMMSLLRLSNLAIQKTVEIEKRASVRKSMEAQEAMRRKSEAREPRKSMARSSFSVGRKKSIVNAGRMSIAGASSSQPIRDQVDSWLREREQDVDQTSTDNVSFGDPRNSTGVLPRPSLAVSEARSSIQDADFDLVDESLVVDEAAVIERCAQHINDFATEGLRTLLYGYRFMDQNEYAAWQKVYHDATTSLVDRTLLIEKAGDLIERDFELGGATAIEDKLQKGVPEAIDKLRRANIKMWMLTGDKRETAINIGHSCRLIKDYSSVTVLDHEQGHVEQDIAGFLVAINNGEVAHSVVVIDGATLALIEAEPYMHALFMDLAVVADSVICCRASPSQKAGLVKAIRNKVSKSVTLAIGDGANDIAMIQEAHVGIGITGKEGLQAARTSDYSIAQFRFLAKLLLVHGRWNYVRTCKYTLSTFWKEFMFYLTQALFQRQVGYTGTSLYESWSLSMFNTLFTSLAVIILGIFEKDLSASTLLAVPELYSKGQRNGGFNYKIFAFWVMMAVGEACIVFFTAENLWGYTTLSYNDIYPLGDLCFSAIVIFINTKILFFEMHNRSWPSLIAWVISVGGWWLWNIALAGTYHNNQIYDVKGGFLDRFGESLSWWATLFLILIALYVVELAFKALKAGLMPSETDIFQALERDLATRKRFEEAAADELQQGWVSRGANKKSSAEIAAEEAEEIRRDAEIRELLRNRSNSFNNEPAQRSSSVRTDATRKSKTNVSVTEVLEVGSSGRRTTMAGDLYDDDDDSTDMAVPPRRANTLGALMKGRFGSIRHV